MLKNEYYKWKKHNRIFIEFQVTNFMFFRRTKVQEVLPKSKSEYLTLCTKYTTNNKLSNICKIYDKNDIICLIYLKIFKIKKRITIKYQLKKCI